MALEYGEEMRGRSGDDSCHHALAVRMFGEIVEYAFGNTFGHELGFLGSVGAAVAGTIAEAVAPSSDWRDDMSANWHGVTLYVNGTRMPFELPR